MCGVLTGINRKRNKEGKPWCITQLEDRTGNIEALVFATAYERLASQVVEDTAVMIRGLVLPEENAMPKISVQDIVSLDNVRIDMPGVISIRVWIGRDGGVDRAAALEELFKRKPGDTSVRLRLESPKDFAVTLLAAELAGLPYEPSHPGNIFQSLGIPYTFPNVRAVAHWLAETPFRPSWIRTRWRSRIPRIINGRRPQPPATTRPLP